MAKKKKDGKGKKKKKTHKGGDEETTPEEAILAYQIGIKERKLEELKFDLKTLEEEKQKSVDRNTALEEEEKKFMANFVNPALEFAKKATTSVGHEQVVEKMKDEWEAEKAEIRALQEIRAQIAKTIKETEETHKDIEKWKFYRDTTFPNQQKQIDLINQEIKDLKNTYDDIIVQVERSTTRNIDGMEKSTIVEIEKRRESAEVKAAKILDKYTLWEIGDHDWLQKEFESHTKRVERLREDVQQLEARNLRILADLFECTVEDLKLSRHFYLTQFSDRENLEINARLQYNLDKLGLFEEAEEGKEESEEEWDESEERPPSAIQRMVQKKLRSLGLADDRRGDENGTESAELKERKLRSDLPGFSPFNDPHLAKFWAQDSTVAQGTAPSKYMPPAPSELKMLSIVGTTKPLHVVPPPSVELGVSAIEDAAATGAGPGAPGIAPSLFDSWRQITKTLTTTQMQMRASASLTPRTVPTSASRPVLPPIANK